MTIQTLRYARCLVLVAFSAIAIWLAFWHHHDKGPLTWIAMVPLLALQWLAWGLKVTIRDRLQNHHD